MSDPATVQDTATQAARPDAAVDTGPAVGAGSQMAGLQNTRPSWQATLPQALALAAADDKPVLVQFTATWCAPCQVMEATIWPDEQVQAAVANHTVPIKIDIDEAANADVVQRYGIRSIPAILLIDADGDELARGGFMGAETLAEFIKRS